MISREEKYIGLMSGSSLDGIDLALISFVLDANNDIVNWNFVDTRLIPYSTYWVNRLSNFQDLTSGDFLKLSGEYAALLGSHVKDFKSHHYVRGAGIHGQTLAHFPEDYYSIQLGNGGIISAIAEVDVVCDFRSQDIGAGGTGAPIVPAVERSLLGKHRYYLNLGGIANISNTSDSGKTMAYDIGPCNQLLNHIASKLNVPYDENGALAKAGNIDQEILNHVLKNEFFYRSGAKALDNGWVRDQIIPAFDQLKPKDGLRTAVELIVTLIDRELNDEGDLYITGGGAHNGFMIDLLKEKIGDKPIKVIIPDPQLIEYKEALLMAYMAYARIYNKVNVFQSVTGAAHDSIAGAWYTYNHTS